MTSGVGDPCRPRPSAQPRTRPTLVVADCQRDRGCWHSAVRRAAPASGRSSRELTADLHTVRSPPSYLASYKTGHRRRRQQTSNLFLSAQPGLSQQTYFGKDIEMKGVGLSQRGLQRSLFTNLRKVLQLYNICFNCPCYEDQGISELTL